MQRVTAATVMTTQRPPTTTITKITIGEDEHYGEVILGTMTGTIIIHSLVLPPPPRVILHLVGARLHMHPNSSHILLTNRRAHPKSILLVLLLLLLLLLLLDLLVVQVTATPLGLTMGMTTMLPLGRLTGMMKRQLMLVI